MLYSVCRQLQPVSEPKGKYDNIVRVDPPVYMYMFEQANKAKLGHFTTTREVVANNKILADVQQSCGIKVHVMFACLTRLGWFEGGVLMWCVKGVLVVVSVPASHDWSWNKLYYNCFSLLQIEYWHYGVSQSKTCSHLIDMHSSHIHVVIHLLVSSF